MKPASARTTKWTCVARISLASKVGISSGIATRDDDKQALQFPNVAESCRNRISIQEMSKNNIRYC